LADKEQRGALDSTEFIIAMYFVKCLMEQTIPNLPSHLPPWLIAAAAVPVTYATPSNPPPPSLNVSLIDLDAPLPPIPVSSTPPSRSTSTWHRQSQNGSIVVQSTSRRGSISSRNSISHGHDRSSNPPSGTHEHPPGRQAPPGVTPTVDQSQWLERANSVNEPPPPYSPMEGTSLSA
jgi:hypothetical protein